MRAARSRKCAESEHTVRKPVGITLILFLFASLVGTAPADAQGVIAAVDDGVYLLRNAQFNRYLDADGPGRDFNVETSRNPAADDEWQVTANADGTHELRNLVYDRLLDADRGPWNADLASSAEPGTSWILEPAPNGNWFLRNEQYDRYLDADGRNSGFDVDLSRQARVDDQWEFIRLDVDPDPTCADSAGVGMSTIESTSDHASTVQRFNAALDANPNLNNILSVDHAAAAQGAGLQLDPNTVTYFGNPAVGTPLMQASRSTAIDLPQKMLIWQAGDVVCVGFNSTFYLDARHGLAGVPSLPNIEAALTGLAEAAADTTGVTPPTSQPTDFGLLTTPSETDFESTWDRLIAAIDASPASVIETIDHAAASGGVLPPTRLAIFGNPNIGTPLMQQQGSFGIDLPLKIVVWEDANGGVQITTNDPAALADRHGVATDDATIVTIGNVINNFVTAAATMPGPTCADQAGDGMATIASDADYTTTVARFSAAIDANPNLALLGSVDHAAAAANAAVQIEPNRVFIFGNPAVGTPLMQVNRSTGLDLPQKMLIWQTGDLVCVGFNSTTYLGTRYGLFDVPSLPNIEAALTGLAEAAAGTTGVTSPATLPIGPEILAEVSFTDFNSTWSRLIGALAGNASSISLLVDHADAAGGVLPPTRLAIFGDPNEPEISAALIQEAPSIGIDLPLKILVWEDDAGQVIVQSNDFLQLAARHGLDPLMTPAAAIIDSNVRDVIFAATDVGIF